jgi:phosphatidylglycerophosphatase A
MSRYTLATLYGAGLSPLAPGTVGSLLAALLAFAILMLPYGWAVLAVGAALFTYLGTQSATHYMRAHTTAHDPKEIVVDELAGQWLTYSIWHGCLFAVAGSNAAGLELLHDVAASPLFLALGFVLFRFFDIVKPWPICLVDRTMKSGFGVMFDDLLAAIPAGLILYVAYLFSPLFLGAVDSTI